MRAVRIERRDGSLPLGYVRRITVDLRAMTVPISAMTTVITAMITTGATITMRICHRWARSIREWLSYRIHIRKCSAEFWTRTKFPAHPMDSTAPITRGKISHLRTLVKYWAQMGCGKHRMPFMAAYKVLNSKMESRKNILNTNFFLQFFEEKLHWGLKFQKIGSL